MEKEIEFSKYKHRGAYHWEQVSNHLIRSNAFVKARYKKCIDLLNHAVESNRKSKILDLGCGDGVLSYFLFLEGADVYGIDPSSIAVKLASEQHDCRGSNAKFFCRSGYDTGFKKGKFDAVICSDVIEHVFEPVALLKEIHRVLKPGGVAIISTPVRLSEKPMDPLHSVEWFPSEFRNLLDSIFQDTSYYYSHPVVWFELLSCWYIVRLLINLISYVYNPFLCSSPRFKYFALQYAVCKKSYVK